MHGTYQPVDGRPALHFERRLAHPVERVWRAVTEPEELGHWFPNNVEVDLRVGGRMRFVFPEGTDYPPMDGEVLELDPPRRFAFTWGEDELRIELEPIDDGQGCLLRFTDVFVQEDKAARDAAGWHVCLDTLEKFMAGEDHEQPGDRPSDEWQAHYDEYQRRGVPSGAEIPS
jgi:uncharacterized protein YndB with AHSA1/START domain